MDPHNPPEIEIAALNVLRILELEKQRVLFGSIESNGLVITQDDVLNTIRKSATTVRDMMQLIERGFMREAVRIESEPVDGRKKRTVEDIIQGIRRCAFSMKCAQDMGL